MAPVPTSVPDFAQRPGTVTAMRGIVFQNDGQSPIGRVFIRPLEALDRWIAGILPTPGEPPLAMHAGLHVEIDSAQEYVAEQLVGGLYLDITNGLNWTPLEAFRQRDRGGWDVTVPATAFRRIDDTVVGEAIERLNSIQGHPFFGEDCTAFIERAFGRRRLFADSPLLRSLGIGARIGDPALPLFTPHANLDQRARTLLQFERIKHLPDPLADADSLNAQLWVHRLVPVLVLGALVCRRLAPSSSSSRRSTPVSSTARKFLR
jgi:hypothetical protein